MQIPALGMDPSFLSWGLAEAGLDLNTGCLTTPHLTVIEPVKMQGKQIRVNSQDLYRGQQIAEIVIPAAMRAKVVFAEVPVGSQSARSMASYGICVGIIAAIRALGVPVIEVTALETKLIFTGNKNAEKKEMVAKAMELYPEANFPMWRGEIADKAQHVADAIAAIHSGVRTPMFQNLMRLFTKVAA